MKKIIAATIAVLSVVNGAGAGETRRTESAQAPYGCTDPMPTPGSTCALLRYKQPYLFPTDAAVDKSRPATKSSLPVPGTTEAYLFYKHPAVYGPRSSAARAVEQIGYYPAPGTREWFRCYKLHDCRKP